MASYVPKSVTNLCPSGAQVANTTGISYFKPEEAAPQEPGKFGSKNTRTGGYIDASLDPTKVDTSVGAKGLASVKGRAQVAANQQKKAATKAYKDTKKDAQKTVSEARNTQKHMPTRSHVGHGRRRRREVDRVDRGGQGHHRGHEADGLRQEEEQEGVTPKSPRARRRGTTTAARSPSSAAGRRPAPRPCPAARARRARPPS